MINKWKINKINKISKSSVMTNNVGIIKNVDVNAKNWLAKVYVINDLFGVQVIVNVDMISHVT